MAVLLILVPIPTSKKIKNLGMRGGGGGRGLAGPLDSTHSQNIHTGEG